MCPFVIGMRMQYNGVNILVQIGVGEVSMEIGRWRWYGMGCYGDNDNGQDVDVTMSGV